MAINLFNKYGSRANPPSIDYPEGSIKNRSAPDVKDGTPLDADWANDQQGFFQSLLSSAGLVANGIIDKVGASQYFDALTAFVNSEKPLPASSSELQSGIDNTKFATAKGLKDAGLWPLGVGQTWSNVTASRAIGTTYTNTTGRPIFIAIRLVSTGSGNTSSDLLVDGLNISANTRTQAGEPSTHFAIVPTGSTYMVATVVNTTIGGWMELR